MEKFEKIKYDSYSMFHAFNTTFSTEINYDLNLRKCIFKHGNAIFNILPVASSNEYGDRPSISLFGKNHPTGLENSQLNDVVDRLNLPNNFIDKKCSIDEDINSCFKFGYKITAIICKEINGKAFLRISPQRGISYWFVIIKSINNEGSDLLSEVEKIKTRFNKNRADNWYNKYFK